MSFERIFLKETVNRTLETAKRVQDWLSQDAENEVFYIVPDHIKFESEIQMLKSLSGLEQPSQTQYAAFRLQVFSFTRLAWYFLKDGEGVSQKSLSRTGLAILLQKILLDKETELKLFRSEIHHKGFIEQLLDLFLEFRQGGIESNQFEELFWAYEGKESEQIDRVKEFTLIYEEFQKRLRHHYLESEELLNQLAQEIKKRDLSRTLIIIDHHYSLRAQELSVIEAFVARAAKVEFQISLTMEAYKSSQPLSQYRSNIRLVKRISDFLKSCGHQTFLTKEIFTDQPKYHSDILLAEKEWLTSSVRKDLPQTSPKIDRIQIRSYSNKLEELREVVVQIKQFIESGEYRYRDFQILTREIEEDSIYLQSLLKEYEVPYFLDYAESMDQHPLLRVIESIFAISRYYWRAEDVLLLLKSELCFWPLLGESDEETLHLYRKMCDITENIVLRNGYEGVQWTGQNPWVLLEEDLDEDQKQVLEVTNEGTQQLQMAEKIRRLLQSVLLPGLQELKQAKTTKEALFALFQLLSTLKVPDVILYWRDQAASKGQLDQARKQEEVWDEFVHLMDEFGEIFGESPFQEDLFLSLLRTGFEQTSYHVAPNTLDQVLLTGMDSIRFAPRKISFVIGVTQGQLPKLYQSRGLLTDEDRDLMNGYLDSAHFLRPSSIRQQDVEPFVFYKMLTSATDYLFFSFPTANSSGGALKISQFLERLAQQLNLSILDGSLEKRERLTTGLFYSVQEAYSYLLSHLREYKYQRKQAPHFFTSLAHSMEADPLYGKEFSRLMQSIYRYNTPIPLNREQVEALYGENLYLSISQAELFLADPFSHFLRYGLRLQERSEFELTAANAGDYFHEFFERYIAQLITGNCFLATLSEQELEEKAHQVLLDLEENPRYTILDASERMKFIKEILQATLIQTLKAVYYQSKHLTSRPFQTEYVFGMDGETSIQLELEEGHNLILRGKIDRIDVTEIGERELVSVVDYKSGDKRFKMAHFLAGLQLQLFVYLAVAKRVRQQLTSKETEALGAFYLHVHQPKLKQKDLNLEESNYEEKWFNSFRLKGVMMNELDTIQALNPLDEGEKSTVLPYAFSKTGFNKIQSTVVSPQQLESMMEYALEKIREVGIKILAGDTSLEPYKDATIFTPSIQGPFASIAQFDATLPENRYRILPSISFEKGLEILDREEME